MNDDAKKAVKSGISATIAMGFQITSLMWLRTTTNYQYRYGTTITDSFKNLYREGGIRRFYKGYIPCLFMGSVCRFGDMTIYQYIKSNGSDYNLNLVQQSLATSTLSMIWRINLMPIDTLDVMLQVNGGKGINILKNKIKTNGLNVLYHGTTAWSITNLLGNFGWFYTYSFLNDNFKPDINQYVINGFNGFVSSAASDMLTNPVRIIKTNKQSVEHSANYKDIVLDIYKKYGILEFWKRGLVIRIVTHGLQGSLFLILWKEIENKINI